MLTGRTVTAVRDGSTVRGSETAKVVALHDSLEALADAVEGRVGRAFGGASQLTETWPVRNRAKITTYEAACTSTCCPGTKWADEMVVPAAKEARGFGVTASVVRAARRGAHLLVRPHRPSREIRRPSSWV